MCFFRKKSNTRPFETVWTSNSGPCHWCWPTIIDRETAEYLTFTASRWITRWSRTIKKRQLNFWSSQRLAVRRFFERCVVAAGARVYFQLFRLFFKHPTPKWPQLIVRVTPFQSSCPAIHLQRFRPQTGDWHFKPQTGDRSLSSATHRGAKSETSGKPLNVAWACK